MLPAPVIVTVPVLTTSSPLAEVIPRAFGAVKDRLAEFVIGV